MKTLRDVGIKLRGYVKHRFNRLFSSFRKNHQCSKEYERIFYKQEDRVARNHNLENEIERLKTSVSEAVSSDPEKSRRDQTAFRASLEKQYRQEINSINQTLKTGFRSSSRSGLSGTPTRRNIRAPLLAISRGYPISSNRSRQFLRCVINMARRSRIKNAYWIDCAR